MKSETDLTGLIHALDISDPEARGEKFESMPSEDTTLVFYQLYDADDYDHVCGLIGPPKGRDDWYDEEQRDMDEIDGVFREVAEACIAISPFPKMSCEVFSAVYEGENFNEMAWVPTSQRQKDWAINGQRYLQVGFFDGSYDLSYPDPSLAVFAAMTVYDKVYAETGIVEPKDQMAIHVDPPIDRLFRLFVGSTYQERFGIWCRDLVNLRNEVMVKARAKLYGDDPESEWKRFCDAGFVHYLDYLKIWKPPER